jgi:outer membrane protein, multidrug efflux system
MTHRAIILAAAAVLLTACAHERDLEPEVALPETFSAPAEAGPAVVDRWWESFDDPALTALVDDTLAGNFQMAQAWSRLDQVAALREQQGSFLWPAMQLEASGGRSRSADPFGNTVHGNRFSLSAAASYEVDVWGKLDAADDAAALDLLAGRSDIESLAMTLVSQVTETWFLLLETRATQALLNEQVKTNEQFLELVQLRFSVGQARAVDVYQQRQQLMAVRSQIPLVEARANALERALAVLVGKMPGGQQLSERNTLPVLGPMPSTGVPSELLENRPDLQAARLRLASQDRRVAAAVADRFPSLRLSANTGYQADSVEDLLDRWVWSIAGSLVLPILDGGRRKAEVARQKAVLDERLAGYSQSLLTAFKEVEDALDGEASQRRYVSELEAQLEVARATLRESRSTYAQGLSTYLPVLQALGAVQTTERNLIGARRQLLSYRVQLHRALGGRWTQELER